MSARLLLPARSVTKSALDAVERAAIDRYSHVTRHDCLDWDEYDELEFDAGGYLVFAIDVQVDEIVYEYSTQVFYVLASMWVGKDFDIPIGDPDIFAAYQDEQGKWDVEYHGS